MANRPVLLKTRSLLRSARWRESGRRWLDWWRPVLVILHRELLDQGRDWRIVAPIVGFTLFFPFLMNFVARRMVGFVERFGAEIVAERFFPFLLLVVGFFPLSISLVIALESFAGERERNTIEPLLIAPISDAQLYLGKLLSVLFLPLLASFLGIVSYIGVLAWRLNWWPEPMLLAAVVVLTVTQGVVMVSAAVLMSTQATSVRAANLLATLIIVPIALLLQAESMFLFWKQYHVLWYIVLALLLTTVLITRVGLAHFNREALLSREMDVLSLGTLWRMYVRALRGPARNLREWYALAVWPEVRRLFLPSLGMMVLLVVSMYIGYALVQGHLVGLDPAQFPAQMRDPDTYLERLQGWLHASVLGGRARVPLALLMHNLRALFLAWLLGMMSFGVVGILTLLLPFGILGGAMAYFQFFRLLTPTEFLVGFVLPHGMAEVPAIVLFGASLLRLGARWITPSRDRSLGDIWMESLGLWSRVFFGVVLPLLVVAAFLEAYLAPRAALWMLAR